MSRILMVGAVEKFVQNAEERALWELLRKEGYNLEAVPAWSEETLDRARALKPDVILLDSRHMNTAGYEACQKLKDCPETEKIPIILLNASQAGLPGEILPSEIAKVLESGVADVISLSEDFLENGRAEVLPRLQLTLRNKRVLSQAEALVQQLTEMNNELYNRNLQLEKELYVTRQLQQSLLPAFLKDQENTPSHGNTDNPEQIHFSKRHFEDEHVRISGLYLPCDALGGDLYDVVHFQDGKVGVSIADVSGHGVPAAFITAIYKASFYRTTLTYHVPGEILFHLNNELSSIIKTGDYITGVYCQLEADRKTLTYSGAGHPYPLFYHAQSDTLSRLDENGTPLVWFKDHQYPTGTVTLSPGDKILMFSDGITEIKNCHRELFGEEALEDIFLEMIHNQSSNLLDEIIQILSDFTQGYPLEDDMSLVLIEMK